MNYEKLYFAFIEKYKNQVFDEGTYTEVHHIIPRHAGGDDSKENLIRLDYRQHIFAHRLLWKAYKRASDYMAWVMMRGQIVDQKVARGLANVESGLLERIRQFANTPERQRKLKELQVHNRESGNLARAQKLANAAWTGQKHSEEWKETKRTQMVEYRATEKGYAQMLEAVQASAEKKKQVSREFSDSLIINAERNEEFLHMTSSRSKSIFISPEGLEFESPIFAAGYYGNVEYYVIENWCKRNQNGWTRKPKAGKD